MKEENTSSDDEILIVEISPKYNLAINAVSQSPPKNFCLHDFKRKDNQFSN